RDNKKLILIEKGRWHQLVFREQVSHDFESCLPKINNSLACYAFRRLTVLHRTRSFSFNIWPACFMSYERLCVALIDASTCFYALGIFLQYSENISFSQYSSEFRRVLFSICSAL